MKAENIIILKIEKAFDKRMEMTDDEIESNPYILEDLNMRETKACLPTLMIYLLKTFRSDQSSMVFWSSKTGH